MVLRTTPYGTDRSYCPGGELTNTNCKREINFSGHFGHLSAETENRACHLVRARSECANRDQVGKNVAPYVTRFEYELYARGISAIFPMQGISYNLCTNVLPVQSSHV